MNDDGDYAQKVEYARKVLGNPRSGEHKPLPGERAVELRCAKCGRRWGDLIGSSKKLRRFGGYVEGTVERGDDGNFRADRFDTRTGRRGAEASQARVFAKAAPVVGKKGPLGMPEYAYERWLVRCHRRCGREVPLRRETLEAAFLEAVARKHGDTRL